jgi:hypothetical protein
MGDGKARMKNLRTILSVWPKKESAEPAETSRDTATGAEPVFSCDSRKQFGYFHLKRGKWAGKAWVARLKCCENPVCHCANVDFYCAMEDGTERPPVLHFALDPMKCEIAPNHDKDRHKDSTALAEAMAAEFGDEEWRCLRQYLLTRKRHAIRKMDVTRLHAPAPEAMTDDGRMVPFGEIFPFGGGFEFELDEQHWMADDQYCVMPDCDCREVVLNFLFLTPSPDDKNNAAKEAVAVARYDYKRDTIHAECEPTAGQPSLRRLVDAARAAHPSLAADAERRHNQLKLLYTRALLKAEQEGLPPVETPVKAEPKVGRNDPCPCGSGKKHKKCCGRAA